MTDGPSMQLFSIWGTFDDLISKSLQLTRYDTSQIINARVPAIPRTIFGASVFAAPRTVRKNIYVYT